MTNEEKAQEIIGCNRENCLECGGSLSVEKGCVSFRRMIEMAEWKEQQMVEKAVEWIKSQMIPYGTSPLAIFNYIEEFKQAMREE